MTARTASTGTGPHTARRADQQRAFVLSGRGPDGTTPLYVAGVQIAHGSTLVDWTSDRAAAVGFPSQEAADDLADVIFVLLDARCVVFAAPIPA